MSPGMMVALVVAGVSFVGIWVLSRRLPHVVDDDWVPPADEDVHLAEGPDEELRDAGVLGRIRAKQVRSEQADPPPTLSSGRTWPDDSPTPDAARAAEPDAARAAEPDSPEATQASGTSPGELQFLMLPGQEPIPAPAPQEHMAAELAAPTEPQAPPPLPPAPVPPQPPSSRPAAPRAPVPLSRETAAESAEPNPPPVPAAPPPPPQLPATSRPPAAPAPAPDPAPVAARAPAPDPPASPPPAPPPVLAPPPSAAQPAPARETGAPVLRFAGVIRGDSSRHADGRERRYVMVRKKEAAGFPWREGARVPVDLEVNGRVYSAGVRSTRSQPVVYIAADLRGPRGEDVTLAAVLESAGMQKRQQVTIEVEGIYLRLLPGPMPPEDERPARKPPQKRRRPG